MLKPLVCRHCKTFRVEPTEVRHGLTFKRDAETMLGMLRDHVAGRHRAAWREIQRALTPPDTFIGGAWRPRWSSK